MRRKLDQKIMGGVVPRVGLTAEEKRKISCPRRNVEPIAQSLYRPSYPNSRIDPRHHNRSFEMSQNAKI
jgi:hypothetical protein